jgi:hypothetical protein
MQITIQLGPDHAVQMKTGLDQRETFNKFLAILEVYTFAGEKLTQRQENDLFTIFTRTLMLVKDQVPFDVRLLPESLLPNQPRYPCAGVVGRS